MNSKLPARMDRRLAIKWMLAAGAGAMIADPFSFGASDSAAPATAPGGKGYGTDPDLMKVYKPGDYWPLTFTDAERREAAALCDVIIPADAQSPSASAVGVADFVDEWVSAPYPNNVSDRKMIMEGLAWLSAESTKRFGASFAGATDAQRLALCEEISVSAPENSQAEGPSRFFRRFRNLTSPALRVPPPISSRNSA
jgi:hypothetical protein